MPVPADVLRALVRLYDQALHLALVLSAAAALAAFALFAAPDKLPFAWFAGQAGVLWGLHRARLRYLGGAGPPGTGGGS